MNAAVSRRPTMDPKVRDEVSVAIDIRNVVKVFGAPPDEVRALQAVTLDIRDNEFFTLLGPSGCGKTTLLRLIAGFEAVTDGVILLYGEEIEDLPPNKRPVNTVFQHYALFPHMSVAGQRGVRARAASPAGGAGPGKRPADAGAGKDGVLRRAAAESALRRTAAARRPGPRARASPPGAAARRAALGARPQAASGDAWRAQAPAARHRHHLRLRHPRSGGSPDDVGPHRGHESRGAAAGGHARGDLPAPRESLRGGLHRRGQPGSRSLRRGGRREGDLHLALRREGRGGRGPRMQSRRGGRPVRAARATRVGAGER